MTDDKLKQVALKLTRQVSDLCQRVASIEGVRSAMRDGRDGKDGISGKDGVDGRDGRDGKDGANGESITKVEVEEGNLLAVWIGGVKRVAGTILAQDGAPGRDGRDGVDGKDGAPGKDGLPGKDGKDGRNGRDGKDGKDGKSITAVALDGRDLVVTIDGVKKKVGTLTMPQIGGGGGGSFYRPWFQQSIVVRSPDELSGTLRSDVEYYIDGIIDFTGTGRRIVVPAGGLSLRGHSFNVSGLKCDDDDYSLFVSPDGGSGDLIGRDYFIEITGSNSKVYDLVDSDGMHAFEFALVNYINCSGLGSIEGYRQGLEDGTGRLGGTPTLELIGQWIGGYRITTSIVRGLDPAMNAPLFKAGAGFTMAGRFLTDINADLGATASLLDFSPSNFTAPSLLQIGGAIIQRDGAFDPTDPTLTPNISAYDLASAWRQNVGLENTYEGGRTRVNTEVETVIVTQGVYIDLAGVYVPNDLQHFDNPASMQLRHLGDSPRDYRAEADLVIVGTQNEELEVRIQKWDDSASSFVVVDTQRAIVNSLAGSRDVALFDMSATVQLDRNDYLKLQIRNNASANNVTAELDSSLLVSAR